MTQFLPDGYILSDKYQILSRLGQGGFAVTYRAMHLILQEEVCIKESFVAEFHYRDGQNAVQLKDQRHSSDTAEINRNVVAEAQALSMLRHKGVVGVRDVFDQNNTSYIVLDFIEGETLKELVERLKKVGSELSGDQLRHIFLHLAEAMQFVHNHGMLHQDISPDNVMVKGNFDPVLIDFGAVARVEIKASTQSRLAFFKDGYSPPELYSREVQPTKASDVYSLAATMVFAITGNKPPDAISRESKEDPSISALLPEWVIFTLWDAPLENAMLLDPERRISELRPMINAFLRPVIVPPPPPPPPKWKKVVMRSLTVIPIIIGLVAWNWRHHQPKTHRKTAEHLFMTIPSFPESLVASDVKYWPTSSGEYTRSAAQQDARMWSGTDHLAFERMALDTAGGFSYTRTTLVDLNGQLDTVRLTGWIHFAFASGKVNGWLEDPIPSTTSTP